jgi:hypothetical protein
MVGVTTTAFGVSFTYQCESTTRKASDWPKQGKQEYIEFCAAVVNELRSKSALLETEFDAARELALLSVTD